MHSSMKSIFFQSSLKQQMDDSLWNKRSQLPEVNNLLWGQEEMIGVMLRLKEKDTSFPMNLYSMMRSISYLNCKRELSIQGKEYLLLRGSQKSLCEGQFKDSSSIKYDYKIRKRELQVFVGLFSYGSCSLPISRFVDMLLGLIKFNQMGIFFAKIKDESRIIRIPCKDHQLPCNEIDTAKYNLLTFLPKSLLLQFTRLSNVVFLANIVLQAIPLISTISPISAISPLAFVLTLSMLREGYEDYKRHKKDWEINSRKTMVLRDGLFEEAEWQQIRVGDILKIKSEDNIPADILLLNSSAETGICYVETANLDGENNLKEKHVTAEFTMDELMNLTAVITVEEPSSNLYDFSGRMDITGRQPIYLGYNNLLLRQTILKNTEEVIGVALYCGHDSKILKNQGNIHHKMSNIEKQVNYIQVALVILLVLLCMVSSIGYSVLHRKYNLREGGSYIPQVGMDIAVQSLLIFFTIFLLLNFLIPITLNILIEGIKTFSAIFLSCDKKLYDKTIKKHCGVLNSSIVEQLGLVDCILTDKTGTLTSNEMIFRAIAIEGRIYSRETIESNILSLRMQQEFHEFMIGMIICHDVIRDTKKEEYQGSSPDEVCFINFASEMGYKFISKTKNIIELEIFNARKRYELVDVLSFSSRRRMSVIVKNIQERNQIIMYTKGADSAIFEKAHWYAESQVFNFNIDAFAKEGLRTLVFSRKQLTIRQLRNYLEEKEKIKIETRERIISKEEAQQSERVLIESLESSLEIIGATGIQDKLQEDVPQTLSRLQQADIKIMMITGDKLETAENIGYLSHLIKENYKIYKISANIDNIQEYALFIRNQIIDGLPFTLMVEGKNIARMMSEEDPECVRLYIGLLNKAKSVIFCRSSPKEKAIIVKFVKDKMKLTVLAIGDGGNDVGMIEQAHIGVGILGKEGNTAATVSDFSFGKFKFLDRLVLHHGRWFYYRLSYFFVSFGQKNMVITLVIFFYMFDSIFSGNLIYTDLYYSVYNAFIGVALLVNYGLFDQDINDDLEPEIWSYLPKIYKETKESQLFSYKQYIVWSLLGVVLSIIIYYPIKYGLLDRAACDLDGMPSDYETSSIIHGIVLTLIVIVINYVDTHTFTTFFINFAFIFCTVLPTAAYFIAQNYMTILGKSHIYTDNLNLRFWLTVFLIVSVVYLAKVGYNTLRYEYFPSTIELYKKAKEESQESKAALFKEYLKSNEPMKQKYNDLSDEKNTIQMSIKDWRSNGQNNSSYLADERKGYKSATIRFFQTEECINESLG